MSEKAWLLNHKRADFWLRNFGIFYHFSAFLTFLSDLELSLRKPNVCALQILQHYLTKEDLVRKFFHYLYG